MSTEFVYIFGGAMGDALLGVHLGRILSSVKPGSKLLVLSTRKNDLVRDLLAPIPFVTYKECLKWRPASWFWLLTSIPTGHKVVYWEPFQNPVSLWWRVIARALTLWPGSMNISCAIRASGNLNTIVYDCRKDSMFDLAPKVIDRWGMSSSPSTPFLEPELYAPRTSASKYVLFHFFAPSQLRTIPKDKAFEIVSAVKNILPEFRFVFTAPAADKEKASLIAGSVGGEVVVAATAKELVSTIANASAYIGVDTGITHLACQLGVPSVVLGNLSNPCWLPYYAANATVLVNSERCGCNGDKTGDCSQALAEGDVYRCLLDISIAEIISSLRKVLAKEVL